MPEIGATLREARMRQRIDISDIEAQTKIRAKYLRALENEEWDRIPGTTFVKSFLRTYAEALGLDSRALLEQYKVRFERLSEAELMITPQTAREREKAARRAAKPSARRDVVIAACVVGLVALLVVLGRGGDDASSPPPRTTGASAAGATTSPQQTDTTAKKSKPAQVRLRLTPTTAGGVYVCLKAGDKLLIDKQTLTPETRKRTYQARSFRILLGNANLTMTIDGERRTVRPSSEPIAFAITAKGQRKPIEADADALCS